MANKYAVASGAWSSTSTWSDTDGGGGGAAVPADGDAVFISAGVSVQMDADLSSFTGLATVTIRGAAGTPGMLYFSGASGYLKIRTAYNLVGTTGTNKGRLLANSDGVWGNTGALSLTYKATVDLQGTAAIVATYLNIALYCTQPTLKSIRTYKDKFDFTAGAGTVDVTNNTIDLGVTPPAGGTVVMITTAAGTLPTGLEEDYLYYVRYVSGTTCKLARFNGDVGVVDITGTGSGTCSILTGHTDTGTATMNVLDDVTGDSAWSTTDGWDRVALVGMNAGTVDQQRLQLTTINAGSVVLSANVDSVQGPCSRIWLVSRNVSIRSAGTSGSQAIVDYSADTTASGVFQCEILNSAGTGTTFYGYGIQSGTGHTISGVISGCNCGIWAGTGHAVSGVIVSGSSGLVSCSGSTVSGTLTGLISGINAGNGNTLSGIAEGCTYGLWSGADNTLSGKCRGGSIGASGGGCHTISGIIHSSSTGVSGTEYVVSGTIEGVTYAMSGGTGIRLSGAIFGCNTAIYNSNNIVVTGAIGYTPAGVAVTNIFDFSYPSSVFCRGALLSSTPSFSQRNISSSVGEYYGLFSEDHGRTLGASVAYLAFGTVTKQNSVVRSGGASTALLVEPLSACSIYKGNGVMFFEWTELSVPAAAQNRSVWIRGGGWSTFPTANELYIEAEYVSNGTTWARTVAKSTAVLTDNTTWVEFAIPEFTPAVAAHVRYRGWLRKYQASASVYVDAMLE